MNRNKHEIKIQPMIVGSGTIVVDIILHNGIAVPDYRAGGTCGNILAGLAFFGWESLAISRAGTGLASNILIKDLAKNGVDTTHISREANLSTPRIIEKLISDGEYAKHSFPFHCPLCNSYLPRFRSPRLDIIGNTNEICNRAAIYFFDKVTVSTLELAKKCRDSGALVFFEPSSMRNLDNIQQAVSICHVLKYTSDNIKGPSGCEKNKKIMQFVDSYKTPLVIHTRGEYGLSYRIGTGKDWYHMDSYTPLKLNDTCGAGDWTTIGFIYDLFKEECYNTSQLIEAINSIDLVTKALNFAQILSALSCMFVGARGLSDSMEKEIILQLVMSQINRKINPIDKTKETNIEKIKDYSENEGREKRNGFCPICLLQIQ